MYFGGLLKNGREEQLKTNHTATDATGVLREVATTSAGKNKYDQLVDKKDIAQRLLPGRYRRVGRKENVISSGAIIEQMFSTVKQIFAAGWSVFGRAAHTFGHHDQGRADPSGVGLARQQKLKRAAQGFPSPRSFDKDLLI
jgi:hypothetical protein